MTYVVSDRQPRPRMTRLLGCNHITSRGKPYLAPPPARLSEKPRMRVTGYGGVVGRPARGRFLLEAPRWTWYRRALCWALTGRRVSTT